VSNVAVFVAIDRTSTNTVCVVTHAIMRGQGLALNHQIIAAMKLAGRKDPVVNSLEFETYVDDEVWFTCYLAAS
jgi:hypothetical protein